MWLALMWYGATSEVPWLFLLAAWVIALLVAAAGYQWWNRKGLRLRLGVVRGDSGEHSPVEDLPEHLLRTAPHGWPLFEGDTADIAVGLDTTRRAQGPAWVLGQIAGNWLTAGTGLIAKPGWRHQAQVERLRRGVIGATGWTITTSDLLGFFYSRRECPDLEVALVYPMFASLAERRPVRELETATATPRAGSGSEIFGIREFRPGDPLRRIHWRSTARRGDLVVREYEPPGVQTIAIAVDPDPPGRAEADQIARIAASEAWDCLREGGRVRLGNVESRDLWELLAWLARYPDVDFGEELTRPDVVVTSEPGLLEPAAMRNWLVGDGAVEDEFGFERVGTQWPL